MRPGQVERHTRDHGRHGTTALFAALGAEAGTVIAASHRRHRGREFRRFLGPVGANVPAGLEVHLGPDDAATHEAELIRDRPTKRPRYHVRFTPTPGPGSTSWRAGARS